MQAAQRGRRPPSLRLSQLVGLANPEALGRGTTRLPSTSTLPIPSCPPLCRRSRRRRSCRRRGLGTWPRRGRRRARRRQAAAATAGWGEAAATRRTARWSRPTWTKRHQPAGRVVQTNDPVGAHPLFRQLPSKPAPPTSARPLQNCLLPPACYPLPVPSVLPAFPAPCCFLFFASQRI